MFLNLGLSSMDIRVLKEALRAYEKNAKNTRKKCAAADIISLIEVQEKLKKEGAGTR